MKVKKTGEMQHNYILSVLLFSIQFRFTSPQDPPIIVTGPSVKKVPLGGFAEFFCHAHGNPKPTITWYFDGRRILRNNSNYAIVTEFSLRIPEVQESLQGVYCCHAQNGHRIQDRFCGSLVVLKEPTSHILPSHLTSVVGSNFVLTCMKRGRPLPSVMWYQNGTPIACEPLKPLTCQTGNMQVNGDELRVSNVSFHNAGQYQCGVWNVVGQSLSKLVVVRVTDVRPFRKFVSSPNFPSETATTVYVALYTGISFPFERNESVETFLMMLNVIGAVTALLLVLAILLHCKNTIQRKRRMKNTTTKEVSNNEDTTELNDGMESQPLEYGWSNLKFIHQIGKGKYGSVYKALAPSLVGKKTMVVAVKSLRCLSTGNLKVLHNEATILHSFSHPNILSLLGVCYQYNEQTADFDEEKPIPPFLLFEFVDGGDLHTFLLNIQLREILCNQVVSRVLSNLEPKSNDENNRVVMFYLKLCFDISSAMHYLSLNGFIHRDLATRNCLLSKTSGIVKVGDFGLSRKLHDRDYYKSSSEEAMPVRWMAPESLLYGQYTSKSDVWSFAVTMWEIFMLSEQPYCGLENDQVLKNIIQGDMLAQPEQAPVWVYNLMRLCWSEPSDRPPFKAIYTLLSNALAHCGNLNQ